MNSQFPVELAAMTQAEYSCRITSDIANHIAESTLNDYEGPCAVTVSVNFASAQHVYICDRSIGIFTWSNWSNWSKIEENEKIDDGYLYLSNAEAFADGIQH